MQGAVRRVKVEAGRRLVASHIEPGWSVLSWVGTIRSKSGGERVRAGSGLNSGPKASAPVISRRPSSCRNLRISHLAGSDKARCVRSRSVGHRSRRPGATPRAISACRAHLIRGNCRLGRQLLTDPARSCESSESSESSESAAPSADAYRCVGPIADRSDGRPARTQAQTIRHMSRTVEEFRSKPCVPQQA